jgi:uncharacterized damage-inducible protein DinB
MNQFASISQELVSLVGEWENILEKLSRETYTKKLNSQNRSIKQILGHMVDSASNNTHRVIHLQYQPSPLIFPDYANFGNNDRWIAIQNYQDENWHDLVKLWRYINLHFAHVILNIQEDKLQNKWTTAKGENVTLEEMVVDFPRHFKLHLAEIDELMK